MTANNYISQQPKNDTYQNSINNVHSAQMRLNETVLRNMQPVGFSQAQFNLQG